MVERRIVSSVAAMDDSRRGDSARLNHAGNERRDESPVGASGTAARRAPARSAANLITWPFALYVLVLGFICVLLVPLTSLWWIVPVLGVGAPLALAVLHRDQPVPHRRNEAEAPTSAFPDAPEEQDVAVPDPGAPGTTGAARDTRTSEAQATSSMTPVSLDDPLSEREREVLAVLATGKTTSEAARDLFVSVGTIKSHTSNIYRKLGARNRAEAIARARELGLLS